MADFDLVLRGKRVITRAGEVARCVADRDHDPVADGDAAGYLTGAGDHPAAAEHQVEVGHESAPL